MPGHPWSSDEFARAREMRTQGKSIQEIAGVIGRSASSVRNKLQSVSVHGGQQPLPVETFEQAARSYAPVQEDRAPVKPEWQSDFDVSEEWRRYEERNAKSIEKVLKRREFTATFGNEPIGIAFISDQHISTDNCVDLKRMRSDAELIARTKNMYCVLGGDGIDNHIKIRAAVLAARSQPSDQYLLYDYYLQILATKILVLISGNHDFWSNQIAGVDMLSWLAEKNRILYSPHEAFFRVTVGGYEYVGAVRHQYRMNSSFNQTHSVKQWFRNGTLAWDFAGIGHHHEPAAETCVLHGQSRWVCRPGSYQITSAYSQQYGFNETFPTCPTIILYPGERRFDGYYDLRTAARVLGWEQL